MEFGWSPQKAPQHQTICTTLPGNLEILRGKRVGWRRWGKRGSGRRGQDQGDMTKEGWQRRWGKSYGTGERCQKTKEAEYNREQQEREEREKEATSQHLQIFHDINWLLPTHPNRPHPTSHQSHPTAPNHSLNLTITSPNLPQPLEAYLDLTWIIIEALKHTWSILEANLKYTWSELEAYLKHNWSILGA